MSEFQFNKEYELSELVTFVGDKIDAKEVTLDTYISTDNMLVNRGGVEPASKLPAASRFNHYKVGDTLFSNIRTYFRKVWFADFEGGASPDVLIFRSNDSEILDPAYLYFLLSNEGFVNYTVLTAKGVKMPRGDKAAIMQYKFFLPDIDKQIIIGNDLLTINRKIELNRQTNQTFEQIAQAIFKSWFVDFDPVKAKIEAKQNDQDPELAAMCTISGKTEVQLKGLDEAALQLLKTIAALFPDALVESELGEIPKGWGAVDLKDMAVKISKGTTPRKADIANADDEENIPFLKVRDISDNGEITRTSLDKIPESVHLGVLKRSVLETNDILFSIAGTIGRVALVEEDLNNSNCNQAVAFVRLKEPEKHLELCRLNLVSKRVQDEVTSKVVQGVQANFSLAGLGEIKILSASQNLLDVFNKNIVSVAVKQRLLLKENRKLAEMRDVLLPKLLSGEITMNEDASIAEAMA